MVAADAKSFCCYRTGSEELRVSVCVCTCTEPAYPSHAHRDQIKSLIRCLGFIREVFGA